MPDILKIAAAYVRVSTDDQTELSPDTQLQKINEYAKSHNMVVPPEYVFMDEGISGRKTEKRDSFNRMIGLAKSKPKQFECVLVWKFSRFARNREDSVVYKSMLRKQLGIDVISVSEPVGDDKMAVLIEALIEAMDEYYSINLSEEVLRGMTENAKRGNLQSIPSFGYKVANKKLIEVPEESVIVKDIFARFIRGDGYSTIARYLNTIGVKTHRNNPFENRTVEYILRNPVYIGKLRWNPTGRTRRKYDNPNIILSDAQHGPIIDEETWEQAQTRVREIKASYRPYSKPIYMQRSWISGMVRCEACGASMISLGSGNAWQCEGYSKSRCSISQHVSSPVFTDIIIKALKDAAANEHHTAYTIVPITSKISVSTHQLQEQKQKLSVAIQRLKEAYLMGAGSAQEYKDTRFKLENEILNVERELQKQVPTDRTASTDAAFKTSLLRALETIQDPDATNQEKQNAFKSVVNRCIWNKPTKTFRVIFHMLD